MWTARASTAWPTAASRLVAGVAQLDDWIDRLFVDGLVNLTARWTYAVGLRLRAVQTGNVRQYVMLHRLGDGGVVYLDEFLIGILRLRECERLCPC